MPGDVGRRGRHDRAGEAEAGGLGEPARDLRDLAQLAAEADLTDEDGVGRDRPVDPRAGDRHRDGEIDARLGDPHPTGDVRVDVEPGEVDAGALLQDRDEQREAAAVERLRAAARDRRVALR